MLLPDEWLAPAAQGTPGQWATAVRGMIRRGYRQVQVWQFHEEMSAEAGGWVLLRQERRS